LANACTGLARVILDVSLPGMYIGSWEKCIYLNARRDGVNWNCQGIVAQNSNYTTPKIGWIPTTKTLHPSGCKAVVDWDGASALTLDCLKCCWLIQVVADLYSEDDDDSSISLYRQGL